MYRPCKSNGDSLMVPQLVFSKLGLPEADEPRIKVALYMIQHGECSAEHVAEALRIRQDMAEKALLFWEGAGLLERVASQQVQDVQVEVKPQARRRLSQAQANLAAGKDPVLGAMVRELQHIFGGMVNQREYEIYCTLYCTDAFPADIILMAAMHCAAEQKCGATRVERTLLAWRKEGLETCADVDAYLRLLADRECRYQEMADILHYAKPSFTASERRIIDSWHEQFGYGWDMVEAARLAAGEKENEIRYLNGILKKWQAKGYATAEDVRRGEEGTNVQVQGTTKVRKTEEDLLQNTYYNPIKRKGGES